MKIEVNGFIHAQKSYSGELRYVFFYSEDMGDSGYVMVCPHTIVFELPEGFDPTGGFIAALEKKKEALHAEFADAVAKINNEISKLQAITYEAPEVV